MKILLTGAAGFIGFHLAKRLQENNEIIGLDNINDYYDTKLKHDRLSILNQNSNFKFFKIDIVDYDELSKLVSSVKPDVIIHLAAQAGVRYSIDNPFKYQKSNLEGFLNILEICRQFNISKLVFASSSSVYGNSANEYFKETDNVDHPISLYAATKKANELMASTYTHLFGFQTIALRFFTVYGPYGRPDMAYFKFLNSLKENRNIQIYNNGNLLRDFTYIDDIVDGIIKTLAYKPSGAHVFNLGNNKPVKLMDFISIIEKIYGKEFQKEFVEMQDGDVYKTAANIDLAIKELNYKPTHTIDEGLTKFIEWYKEYYKC